MSKLKNSNALFYLETGLFLATIFIRPAARLPRRIGHSFPNLWDGALTAEERRYGLLPGDGALAESIAHEYGAFAHMAKTPTAPAGLLLAIAHMGSRGKETATSSHGAVGLMQLTPEVVARYKIDAKNPDQALSVGALLLTELQVRYPDDFAYVLLAWMQGTAIADQTKRRHRNDTKLHALSGYVQALGRLYEEILK